MLNLKFSRKGNLTRKSAESVEQIEDVKWLFGYLAHSKLPSSLLRIKGPATTTIILKRQISLIFFANCRCLSVGICRG